MKKIKSDELRDAIQFVTESGVMSYYSDGAFRANGTMTKGVFYKLLVLIQMSPEEAEKLPDEDAGKSVFFKYKSYCQKKLKIDLGGDSDVEAVYKKEVYDAFINVFGTFYNMSPSAFPPRIINNEEASRAWIANELYLFVKLKLTSYLEDNEGKKIYKFFWHEFFQKFANMPRKLILAMADVCESGKLMLSNVIRENWEDNYLEDLLVDFYTIKSLAKGVYDKLYSPQKAFVGKAYHYTSLRALFNILKQTEEYNSAPADDYEYEECISESHSSMKGIYYTNRIYMCNAEFLNDPDEGTLLLNGYGALNTAEERKEIYPKEQFTISLTTNEKEYLPMWSLYGDKGKGCRIEFEIDEPMGFKPVLYIDDIPNNQIKEKEVISQNNFNNKVKECIDEIVKIRSKYERDKDLQIILDRWIKTQLLSTGYLFKTAYYSYEKEIRYVKEATASDIEIEELQEPYIAPRIHSYVDVPLKITEIRLGPKCMNPSQVAAVLNYYGIPRITKSDIHFQ